MGHSEIANSVPTQTVFLPPPAPDCPVCVVAARVPSTQKNDPTQRFVSGWGESRVVATRSCKSEAAERLSAQIFGDEVIKRTTAVKLGTSAVSPLDMLLISEAQYAARQEWNAQHPGFNKLPEPWLEDQPIDWVSTNTELSSADMWLPAGLCFLGHVNDRGSGLPPADSNGVAAGESPEDAALRAFLELVERDAVAIWWYNRLTRPRLDPAGLDEPLLTAYEAWSTGRGRVLQLQDLTHDLEVPVVAAVAHGLDGSAVALGFGAGLTAKEAARHAVGELAQFECNVAMIERHIAAQGEGGLTPEAQSLLHWWRTSTITDQPHLAGGDTVERLPTGVGATLEVCHELCLQHGMMFLALDLTRPAIGVPVVRVVVPGLRPMWARFAPGRLYDTPVRLGWRDAPLTGEELNPTPLMF